MLDFLKRELQINDWVAIFGDDKYRCIGGLGDRNTITFGKVTGFDKKKVIVKKLKSLGIKELERDILHNGKFKWVPFSYDINEWWVTTEDGSKFEENLLFEYVEEKKLPNNLLIINNQLEFYTKECLYLSIEETIKQKQNWLFHNRYHNIYRRIDFEGFDIIGQNVNIGDSIVVLGKTGTEWTDGSDTLIGVVEKTTKKNIWYRDRSGDLIRKPFSKILVINKEIESLRAL